VLAGELSSGVVRPPVFVWGGHESRHVISRQSLGEKAMDSLKWDDNSIFSRHQAIGTPVRCIPVDRKNTSTGWTGFEPSSSAVCSNVLIIAMHTWA
jgi:hypothetical protein